MAIRVLLITQWFDPEPTFKGLVFARELVKQGFEVEVITGFPNYPGGKLYSGYKLKLWQRELIDGVKVTRVPLYPSHDQGALGRVLNYVSFAASSLIYGLFFAKKPDVIYAYHPPLTVGIAAALIRLFRRVPMVYDIQDMWPDTLKATGMFSNEKALKLVSAVCNWVYRRADQLVVLSPGFKSLLIDRGVPDSKIEIIYNWSAENIIDSGAENQTSVFPDNGRFQVLFAGNMGRAQALTSVLEAAEILQAKNERVDFIFLGGGLELESLKALAKRKHLNNVAFYPAVPMREVSVYLNSADALIVHLKRDPLFSITIPSKTQAYMAAGRPIVMAVLGDASDLIRKSRAGVVAEPENPESIAEAVKALSDLDNEYRNTMAKSGSDYYKEHLSLKVGVSKFTAIFTRLASLHGRHYRD